MRECFEWNGSAQNGSKASCKREAYPYLRGKIPKSRVNAALNSEIVLDERAYLYISCK